MKAKYVWVAESLSNNSVNKAVGFVGGFAVDWPMRRSLRVLYLGQEEEIQDERVLEFDSLKMGS